MSPIRVVVGASCLVTLTLLILPGRAADPVKYGVDPKVWKKVVDKGVDYLKTKQAEDGTWSKSTNEGITSLVVLALVRSGEVPPDDPMIQRALKFTESLADKETGHIAGESKPHLRNYMTSINLLALQEVDAKRHAAVIKKAADYLKVQPFDEAKEKNPKDVFYGGVGYGGETRPDMSNTVFLAEALRAAGVAKDDPAFKKIAVYVSRSQNLAGEFNDQPWAGKINDGSFHYGAGPASQSRAKDAPADTLRPGYGSMTCAGLTALDTCGIKKDDPRYQKAWEYVQKEFTVDMNPGQIGGRGAVGYYYYLQALARCLDRMGVDEITDARGRKHDWRKEITFALGFRQQRDGHWTNETTAFMEGNADLATAWALIALSHCKQVTK